MSSASSMHERVGGAIASQNQYSHRRGSSASSIPRPALQDPTWLRNFPFDKLVQRDNDPYRMIENKGLFIDFHDDDEKDVDWRREDLSSSTSSSTTSIGVYDSHTKDLSGSSRIGSLAGWSLFSIAFILFVASFISSDVSILSQLQAEYADTTSASQSFDPIVRAASQKWRGKISESGLFISWKGIRYAQAPTGDLRFRLARRVEIPDPPSNEDEWERLEVVNATQYGDGCPRWKTKPLNGKIWGGDEDCLKLHVFAPSDQVPGKLLPVMFWIHGGGFHSGAAHLPKYDTTALMHRAIEMREPIIIVSINYRLGALGFTSNSAEVIEDPETGAHLRPKDSDDLDLNAGLKDQIEALRWVRKEIANFGGDPDKIVIAGHSAGAISVGLHQMYIKEEMFRGAIMLSGSPLSFPIPWPHEAATRSLKPMQEPAGCRPLARGNKGLVFERNLLTCLRALPLHDLMQSTVELKRYLFPWYPVLEGDFEGAWLTPRPSDKKHFRRVPFLTGTVLDEGTKFTSPDIDSPTRVEGTLRRSFAFVFDGIQEDVMPRIWELYPPNPTLGSPYRTGSETFGLSSSYKRAASLIGDIFFQAPKRYFLEEVRELGEYEGEKTPMWNYVFGESPQKLDPKQGVHHGADLASWFGTPRLGDQHSNDLAKVMSSYLINFVAHLDPNGKGAPNWPEYGKNGQTMRFENGKIAVGVDADREEAVEFINDSNDLFAR